MSLIDGADQLLRLLSAAATIATHVRALADTAARLMRRVAHDRSYENLRLAIVLDIQDRDGRRAVLARHQRVRFYTSDCGIVRDLVWGEGAPLVRYTSIGARRLAVQPEGSRRAILLGLGRRPRRGEQVSIHSRRLISNALTEPTEYCEALVERPTQRLSLQVLFPPTRPPDDAYLASAAGQRTRRLPVRYTAAGRPSVTVRLTRPVIEHTYSVRWSW